MISQLIEDMIGIGSLVIFTFGLVAAIFSWFSNWLSLSVIITGTILFVAAAFISSQREYR